MPTLNDAEAIRDALGRVLDLIIGAGACAAAPTTVVDLAVERGGNCPLARPDQGVVHKGVAILGTLNLAGRLAGNASPLFAKNLANFLDLMVQKDGTLKVDFDDEIIKGTMIAKDGALVHPIFKAA